MPSFSGSNPRSGDLTGTLQLLAYLALAFALLGLDHNGGWLSQLRARATVLAQPLWTVAGLPARFGDVLSENAATRSGLVAENRTLRNALLISGARVARLQTAAGSTIDQGKKPISIAPAPEATR